MPLPNQNRRDRNHHGLPELCSPARSGSRNIEDRYIGRRQWHAQTHSTLPCLDRALRIVEANYPEGERGIEFVRGMDSSSGNTRCGPSAKQAAVPWRLCPPRSLFSHTIRRLQTSHRFQCPKGFLTPAVARTFSDPRGGATGPPTRASSPQDNDTISGPIPFPKAPKPLDSW